MKEFFDRMIDDRMIRSRILIILSSIILSILRVLLFIILLLGGAPATRAASSVPAAPQTVSPAELDRAIDEVIHQRKYTWRLPRETIAPEATGEGGLISKFFTEAGRLIRAGLKGFFEWLGRVIVRVLSWVFRGWSPPNFDPPGALNWYLISQVLLYVLVAVVLSAAVILLYRMWLHRRRPPQILQTEALQSVPDLTDESVDADQLPEDGWTKLARELLARGEFRLALRAFYLASLAHLAERNLLSLARFKSNHDYELELGRRAHSFPNLLQVFGENVGAFDRVWYGTHEASGDLVSQFAANVERIKAGG